MWSRSLVIGSREEKEEEEKEEMEEDKNLEIAFRLQKCLSRPEG